MLEEASKSTRYCLLSFCCNGVVGSQRQVSHGFAVSTRLDSLRTRSAAVEAVSAVHKLAQEAWHTYSSF